MARKVVLSLFFQICFLLASCQSRFPILACEKSFPMVFMEQTAQQIQLGLDRDFYGCSSCDSAIIVTYKIDVQIVLEKDSSPVLQVTNISYDSPLGNNERALDPLFYVLDDDPIFYIEYSLKRSHFCCSNDDIHQLQTNNLVFIIPLHFVRWVPDADITQIKRQKRIRRGNHCSQQNPRTKQ